MENKTEDVNKIKTAEAKIDYVVNLKKKYEQTTQKQRSEWKKYVDAQEATFNGVSIPFQSQHFVPKISTAVSIMTPIVIGNFPSFKTIPIGIEDIPKAKVMEKILKYQADYELDLYSHVVQWVTQGALLGTSYMYSPWVVRKDADGKKIFDNIELEVVSPFDIFYNPLVPSIAELEKRNLPLIARFWTTIDDIKSNPLYEKAVKVKTEKKADEGTGKGDSGYESSDILNIQQFNEDSYLYTDVKKIVVYYYWTKDKLKVVARGADKWLLYDGKNPWGIIPYTDFKWEVDPVPSRAFGRGIGKQGMDISDVYNKLFNQLADNVRNSANQMYQRRRGARVDPRQLISRPSGFIDVDEIDKDVKQIDNRIDIGPIRELLGMVDQQFQIATANTDIINGVSGADSASEAIILNRNSALRIELIRKNFAIALQRLGRLIKHLDLQNIKDLKIIRIFNEESEKFELQKIEKDQFKGEYDIQVEPDESLLVNKDIMRKQLLDLANLTKDDPEAGINRQQLYKEITRGGVRDVEKFFKTPEEIESDKKKAQDAQMMAGGGIGLDAQNKAINGQMLPAPENGLTDKSQMQQINAQNQN
jgi:hypothetical protein